MGRGRDGLGSQTIYRDGLELQAAPVPGAVIPGVGVEPFKSRMDTPCLPALDNRVFPFQGYSRISTFLQDGSGLLKTAAELVL